MYIEALNGMILIDLGSYSFGVEVDNGIIDHLVNRNSSIPTKKSKTYTTSRDYQVFHLSPRLLYRNRQQWIIENIRSIYLLISYAPLSPYL